MSLNKYVRGCVSLLEIESQGKAVEVTVTSKEETLKTFVWILSKNSASGPAEIRNGGGGGTGGLYLSRNEPIANRGYSACYVKYAASFKPC